MTEMQVQEIRAEAVKAAAYILQSHRYAIDTIKMVGVSREMVPTGEFKSLVGAVESYITNGRWPE